MNDDGKDRDFHHPFEPYDIQTEFMNAVFDCLEDGKVGIFESPTGTGKSLSLICGSLTWLRDHNRRKFEDGFAPVANAEDDPAWMIEHAQTQKRLEALRRRQEFNNRIARIKAKEKRIKERNKSTQSRIKRQKIAMDGPKEFDGDEQFILDEYESDEDSQQVARFTGLDTSGLSFETQALMEQLGYSIGARRDEEDATPDETKIFFCSRTHSQLKQFSRELGRVNMPPTVTCDDQDDTGSDSAIEDVKHITLGSRKNLCINDKVIRLGNPTAINERCIELQQAASVDKRCSHIPTKDKENLLFEFRDHALAKIRDIEDLGLLGKKLGICPYYSSRSAVQHCEIVTLPYPLLLQKSAREALGISLKGHIVIIDEAHNLMDAMTGMYSVSISLEQVLQARAQLTTYLQKFRNKLKGKNRVYVAQTVRILDSIISYLRDIEKESTPGDGLADMLAIMSGKGVDQVNIFKLNTYLQKSRLARKVDGYTAHSESIISGAAVRALDTSSSRPRQNVPVLMHVQAFLHSLMNPSAEGRFFYSKEDGFSTTLRYMLLDPTFHFKDIVEDARAVILAGGTMSPMSDYKRHLFSYLDPAAIMTISCGHVIPPTNLLALPITKALSGAEFDLTFENRNKETTFVDLGNTIATIVQHVPDGIVIFFPSYAYMEICIAAWRRLSATGDKITFWERFTQIKPIFLEQRSQQHASTQTSTAEEGAVNTVLSAYTTAIASGKGRGALLFAVIGGTLSEGINFSDTLGRGVVVIGLPFANPHSTEWKAKLQYISAMESRRGGDPKAAAREFIENACMRAVNQCVGRAIRHKGDYAAIVMLDRRYGTPRIQSKLPGWIRGSLTTQGCVKDVGKALEGFFADKT